MRGHQLIRVISVIAAASLIFFLFVRCSSAAAESGSDQRHRKRNDKHARSAAYVETPVISSADSQHPMLHYPSKVELTKRGRRVRTVVVAAMVGHVCDGDDWRGGLPRFLAHAMPRAQVIRWASRYDYLKGISDHSSEPEVDKDRAGDSRNNGGGAALLMRDCSFCRPAEGDRSSLLHEMGGENNSSSATDMAAAQGGGATTWPCDLFWREGRTADVLLVIGTGEELPLCSTIDASSRTRHRRSSEMKDSSSRPCVASRSDFEMRYPSLTALFRQPWMRNDTLTIHIPIRQSSALKNNMSGFRRVILDSSFTKPLQDESVTTHMGRCEGSKKANDLIYVARYDAPHKGQTTFLQQVDPELLRGYTIHFYGARAETGLNIALEKLGKQRDIRVVGHEETPKAELLSHLCHAQGHIHYALDDDNPRAVYEGLYAGNPLFVSVESNVANVVLEQPFVVGTSVQHGDLNADFARFMELVKGADRQGLHARIKKYAEENLSEKKVYLELCQRMGLCSAHK